MTFKPEKVPEFQDIFNRSKKQIRNFPGCQHLELHGDYTHGNIFATYSIWQDQNALDNYRNSDLFKQVWSQTKVLFEKNPIAFSSLLIEEVDN
jgi:quinol monooxygenase YgiN